MGNIKNRVYKHTLAFPSSSKSSGPESVREDDDLDVPDSCPLDRMSSAR